MSSEHYPIVKPGAIRQIFGSHLSWPARMLLGQLMSSSSRTVHPQDLQQAAARDFKTEPLRCSRVVHELPQISDMPTKVADYETLHEFIIDIQLYGSVFGRCQVNVERTFTRGQPVF
jgi:hypothetical protein